MSLNLNDLRDANNARQKMWDPEGLITLSYRGNEMGGECGEAQNELKKLEREKLGLPGSRTTIAKAATELADIIICADLCAAMLGIDLGRAVRDKFNETSEKVGFDVRL